MVVIHYRSKEWFHLSPKIKKKSRNALSTLGPLTIGLLIAKRRCTAYFA